MGFVNGSQCKGVDMVSECKGVDMRYTSNFILLRISLSTIRRPGSGLAMFARGFKQMEPIVRSLRKRRPLKETPRLGALLFLAMPIFARISIQQVSVVGLEGGNVNLLRLLDIRTPQLAESD